MALNVNKFIRATKRPVPAVIRNTNYKAMYALKLSNASSGIGTKAATRNIMGYQ